MNDNITALYNALKDTYDIQSEEYFREYLKNDSNREALRKALADKYDVGDSASFAKYLGFGEENTTKPQQSQQSQQSAPVANGGQYVAQDAGVAHYPIDPAKMRAAGAKPAAAVRTAGQSLGEAQKAKSEAMKAAKSGDANAVSDFSRSMDANIKALNAQHEQNSKSIELAKKRAMTMSGNDRSVAMNPVTGKFENGFVTRSGNVVFSKAEQDIADKGIRESMRPDEALNNIFDAYDGGASTEAAWSEAESLTASEADAAAIEASKNPAMFMPGTAAGAAASASLMQKGMVARMTYHDLQRMADRSWEMLGLEKRSKICESVYSMLKKQNPGADETELWENAKRIARAENDKKMFDLAVKKNAPKDATDAFMKNAIEQNTLYTILKGSARKVAGTTGDMEARDVAMNNYLKDHLGLRVGSTVAGFMTDPLTYASGGFGGFAAKGSMWLGGKVATKFATKAVSKAGERKIAQTLAGRVASGVVGGSGNLAVFESGKEAANQYQWGGKLSVDDNGRYVVSDYSLNEIGKSLGHGALMGAGIGWVGPVFGNVSTKAVNAINNTAMKGVVRASELGVTVLAEGTIFAAPDMYKAVHDYNVIIDSLSNPNSQYYVEDEDERAKRIAEIVEERGDAVLDVWTDSMATMAGFKIQGMLKSAPRRIMELSADPNTKAGFETRLRMVLDGQSDAYRLTKDEQRELENGGYSDLRKLVDGYIKSGEDVRKAGVSPSTKLIGDGGESELPYNRFIDLMQDKNISQAARAKMYYYITGNMLPMSTVMDSGVIEHKDGHGNVVGYTVRSLGANDEVITSRTFESKKDAEREERRIFRQAELNGINMGEVYTDTFAEKKRMFDACKSIGEQNGMAAEPLYRIMQMDADKMSEVERKWADAILETYEGLGDKYSSESIRKDINKAYGVDVDKVVAMEPGRRSDVEKEALKDYARRLYKDSIEEANRGAEDVSNGEKSVDESEPPVIGTDRENASFRRGYNAKDEESRDIYSEYKNNPEDASVEAAWNGVLKRINDDVDTEVAKRREELKGVANDDGIVYEVSLKEVDAEGKPKKAYIKSGNVVMSADGNGVDKAQSDSTVVIINPETGKKEMIDPTSEIGVASIDSMAPMEAVVAEYRKDLEEKSASLINELMGVVNVNPGDDIVLPDGRPAKVVAVDGDDVVAVLEDGSQVSTTVTALQEYADMVSDASYRDRHDVVPPSNDEAANVPATSAPERVEDPLKNIPGRVDGTPEDYTAGVVLVVRDNDGNENTAVCQGRFRISADGKSKEPDANGRFVGYVEKGKNEVTFKTKEAMDDITEAWVEEKSEDNAEPVEEAAMPTADATGEGEAEEGENMPTADTGRTGAENGVVAAGENNGAVDPERKAEPVMSDPEAVYEEAKNKYGDKVGHKLDVTVADKKSELNKKAKAMAKAQAEYDDAPIGKEDAAEKKLVKAQAEYDAANAEYDRWASVKAVHDAKEAEARKAAEEEAKALAEAEEAKLREEENENRVAILSKITDKRKLIEEAKRIYGDLFNDDMTPADVYELVAENLPFGLAWEDIDGVSTGLKRELGSNFKRGVGRNVDISFGKYLKKNGTGIPFWEAVRTIYDSEDNMPLGTNYGRFEDPEIRSAVVELFSTLKTQKDIELYSVRNRIEKAEEILKAMEARYKEDCERRARLAEIDALENELWQKYLEEKSRELYEMDGAQYDEFINGYNKEYEDYRDYLIENAEYLSSLNNEEYNKIIKSYENVDRKTEGSVDERRNIEGAGSIKTKEDGQVRDRSLEQTGDGELVEGARTESGRGEVEASKAYEGNVGPADIRQYEDKANVGPRDIRQYGEGASVGPRDIRAYEEPIGPMPLDEEQKNSVDNLERLKEEDYTTYLSTLENMSDEDLLSIIAALGPNSNNASLVEPYEYYDARHRDEYNSAYDMTFNSINSIEDAEEVSSSAIARYKESDYCSQDRCDVIGQIDAAYDKANELRGEDPDADATGEGADDRNIEADKKEVANIISNFRDLFERNSNGRLSNMMMQDVSINGTGTIAMAKSTAKYMSDEELADYIEKYNKLYDDVRNAGIDNAEEYLANNFESSIDIFVGKKHVPIIDILKDEAAKREAKRSKDSGSKFTEREIGNAVAEQLNSIGVEVHADVMEYQHEYQSAKADKSEAGKPQFFTDKDGNRYGFARYGKIYIDPRQIDGEKAIHEYAHLWSKALELNNPEGWQSVVDMLKGSEPVWKGIAEEMQDATDGEIASEIISRYSGKKGGELLDAEIEKLSGDGDIKSVLGNALQNIKKAIQDFWKMVGNFLHINYSTPEQVYDQVVKDFASGVNPRIYIEKAISAKDEEYAKAVESGNEEKAKDIFNGVLKETIGNGAVPYMNVANYRSVQSLAHKVKTGDAAAIKEAADMMAPLVPSNAVLVPMVGHTGVATDMMQLANAIAENTGRPVVDALESDPRDSQYESKKEGVVLSAEELGVRMKSGVEIPDGMMPVVIDNVVGTGNTAMAAVNALGKGVVLSLGSATGQFKRVAELKSANVIERDAEGNLIPLSERFNILQGANIKKQKAEGAYNISESDKAAGEMLDELMMSAGIPMEFDDEAQRVLDMKIAETKKMKTWHGSSAIFDAFDSSHFFEGEGSMVYGAGHYVTNVEETGRLYANIAANTNGIKKNLRTPNDVESERSFIENRIKEAKEWGIQAQVEYWQNELDNLKDSDIDRQLYEVDIPDDNGSNYIDWNTNDPNVLKDIASKTPYYDIIKYGIDRSIIKDFSELYRDISRRSGSNTAASKILNDAGFSGIKVPTGNRNGGDGRGMNYVIFNDNDLRIVNRISFHKVDDYPVYFSNAYRAVEGIKQEKATPEQWLAMLQKNGGLKAGEDKWIGLSDWLKERSADAKRTGANTITKDEVLQYIADNKIEIEEVEYGDNQLEIVESSEEYARFLERYEQLREENENTAFEEICLQYGVGPGDGVFDVDSFGEVTIGDAAYASQILGVQLDNNSIHPTRLKYTTEGLENKKEIALVVPTIEPYNQSDEIHFGDAGDGRAVAWVRFGDANIDESIIQLNEFEKKMEDKYGVKGRSLRHVVNEEEKAEIDRLMKLPSNVTSKVLVIDEIQSKRHQDGREKGYSNDITKLQAEYDKANKEYVEFKKSMFAKYDRLRDIADLKNFATDEEYAKERELAKYERHLDYEIYKAKKNNVPDAPFDKNWHELAMKRMLRYAAENGYDKVAWTTGAQQAERYNISSVVDKIFISKVTVDDMTGKPIYGNVYDVFVHNNRGEVISEASGRMDAESVDKTFGKDLSNRLINGAEENVGSEFEVSGDGLTIGGEGMKGFYDRMLPQFMDKYGKKWGVKTGTVTLDLPNEADRVMHSVDVTPEMKESVMEGQPMFFKTEDGDVYGFTMDGKIYIDRRVAGSETRIHEYSHMWCEALRKANPKAWEQLKKLMSKEEDLVDYVKRKYPELTSIDDIMDEVFAQYSGKRGAERLNKEMRAEMEKAEGVFEKAKIRKIFGKIKAMLDIFWDMARDLFSGSVKGISKMSADDFADMAFNDLLNGFNPMKNDRVPARLRDDLMGVHHISEEKLKKALKLGGLANPSMAVVDTRKGYQLKYGDITLIPRFTIIEKQRGRNAGTWTADAWTPTYPTVTSMPGKSTGKAYKSILNDWYSAEPIKEMRDALERRLRYFTYAEDGNSEPRLAYQFLKERGEAPDVRYRKNDTDKDFYSFLVELSEETNIPINELAYSNEYDRVEQYLIDSTIKKERERISGRLNRALETNEEKFVIDQAYSRWKDQRGKIDNYIYTTNKYANRPDVEVDAEKTLSEAEFIVNRDSRIRKDYERWVDELRDRLGMEDKVFAGYTPSGNRKFVSNTLENVSRLMNRGGQAGGFGWTGPGTFIAKVSKKANTLEAIKKNKGKIIGIDSSMLHDEAKDHINSEFFDLSQVLNQGYGRFEGVGENRLIELADVKGNVKSYLKREYDVDVDDEWIERYYKLVDFIQNKYPVFYFETKFNRPVEFWEFDSAVVPEGTSDEVIEGLKSHGINVVEYDRTKDGEQERVTMDVANDRYGIKFQKGKTKAQKEVNNITEQENGVLYHTAMTMQSNFMKENGNLPLEMGVFTDNHFVIVNNVSVGNIYPVRAFKIEESKDEIKKELQELVRNEGNEISDSTRRTIEEARSKYGIVVYNTDNIGDGGNGVQDADMGGRQQSERGADNALDSGEYISDGLSRIEELDKEYLEAVENGDIEKAQQMVNDAAAGVYNSSSSYQGSLAFNGAAPSSNAYFETKEERKEAFDNEEFEGDMSLGDYIDNGIDNWDLEWKLNNPIPASARDKATLESIRNISNAVKRGDGKIKMYRAVRDDIEESTFRNGDWITPSKEYAQRHIELQDWEGGRIIEQEVSVDDIWWDGNDINEWGYDDGKNYAYRNTKNNKKLLDSVTYDDEGNVIPLSKRFDIDNPDIRYRTSEELDESNPGWREQKTTSGGHSTQIKGTLSTYKKIGEFLRRDGENPTILDASSGFGHGTKALREMGFDVEDVEPYPSDNREEAPTYTAYADIDKKYDVVISNAVLNVIPDDWRDDVLKAMADKTNVGGRMIINVRGDKEIASQGVEGVTKETLDTPSEILVKNADGSYRAYQKGFSKRELKEYVESVLGEGWEVEIGNEKNSGISNGTVVVAKRLNGKPLKYRDGDYTRYPSYETRLKRARRSGYSKSQYDALLEREWDNMVNTANDLIEKLGMKDKVTLVERRDSLKGKKRTAKGWFDAKTGKVTIVLQNNTGADDVMKTIFHECVAHYGLRKMFGEYFDDFLVNVYNNCTPEVRGDILGIMFDKKIGLNEATEEYIAKVAEEDDYTRMNIFWDRIKTLFFEMLNKLGEAGMKIKNLIGKNEIRYILWRSYENLVEPGRYNPIVIAKDVVMRDKCGMPQYEYEDDKMYMVSDNNDDTDPDGDGPRGGVPSSNGQTKSENFKRWFGDWEKYPENASKVVDENGRPKVVYHGTNKKFWVFDPSLVGKNYKGQSRFGTGIYFSGEESNAREWSKIPNNGYEGRVISAYLDIKNPVYADKKTPEDVLEYIKENLPNVNIESIRDKASDALSYIKTQDAKPVGVEDVLKTLGYDGIILNENTKDSEYVVFYPNQIKSTENYGTFGEEESDIRFRDGDEELGNIWKDGSMGLQERVTASKVRIAEALKEDKEARDEALNAIVDDLHSLRKAVSIQKGYDKTTVKRVADLARVLIQTGYMNVDEMGRGDIKRLLSAVKNSTGRNDVSESVERVMDIMIESQLKHAESDLNKLLKIKGEKVDAKGVQVQGRVDVKGQEILKAFKSAKDWDIEKIDEAMASRLEEMESDDEAIKEHARNEYIGLSLAMDYLVSIKDSKYEESELKTALGKAGRATDADREYIQSLKDALMENRIERINDYHEILRNLSVEIAEGIERAKSFKNDEIEHKQEIYHNANSDLAGKPNNEHMPKDKHALLNAAADSVLLPLGTFEQMFKLFGSKSANGEGYLYNRFMRGYIDASDKEWRGYTSKIKTLDDKVSEIFNGKVKTLADLITGMRKMPKMYVAFNDGSQISTKELNQGAMLYLYMVNKMADGRMKLRKMGITRDMIEDVKNHLEPKLIELADWIQDEFLVDTRNEYNETHKRLFGAPMAAVEHYFPLKINPNSRVKSEDEINRGDADFNNTITSKTGSIIKRTKNSYALDILNANALEIIADHVAQMEHWNAFAELNRDLNTLLGYKNFSNKLKNMKTVYGTGEELYNRFRDLCQVAVGAYRPKTSHMDSAVTSISKGVSAANVSLRLHTALKQLLSIPAFVPDTRVDQFVKNLANPYNAVKWSMENLPMVNKRWSSRMSGDPRLMKTEADWKYWRSNVMQQASKFGMTPNAFVDLVAVSVGAKAVYDTRLAAYKKEGYSAEEADKRAKQDAEIVYNLSQQSSEGAFLSTMQKDRTMASVMFTLYRNAAMAYTRQGFTAMRSILNSLKDKEGMIEFMKKQYERDGMSEAQAEKNAKKKFWRENGKNLTRAAVFGYVLQYLWNLGGSAMYLLLGSDDEEKEKMLEEVKVKSRLGFLEGLTGGDVMSESYKMAVLDQFNADYAKKELPVVSDTYKTLEKFNNGYTGEGLNDLINVVVSTGVGINPRTVEDAVSAIVDACEGDVDLANEAAIFAMKVISAPQGAIERLYFDEIGLSVEEGSKLTPQELIERYATYKTRRDNFNSLDWDNEKSKEKNAKRGTKDVKERVERYTEPEAGETFADFSDKIKEWHKESEASRKSGDAGFGTKYDEREGDGMNATYQLLWNKNFNAVGKLEEMEKAYLNAKTPEDADEIFSAIKKYKAGIHDVVNANGDYEKQKKLYGETVKVYVDFLISHPELRKK